MPRITPAALRNLLSHLEGSPLLVIGDVILDEYIWGSSDRISPEAPVPVVQFRKRTFALGGAGNAAQNASVLGGQVILGGALGNDDRADVVIDLAKENGIDHRFVRDNDRPTSTKMRIFANGQQVARIDREETALVSPQLADSLLFEALDCLPRIGCLLISDYNKGVVTPQLLTDLIVRSVSQGIPVVVDPKGSDFNRYRGATVVTPNLKEATEALDLQENATSVAFHEIGARLIRNLNGTAILLTRGSEGMTLFEGNSVTDIPAVALRVYDVTGAGDTVAAALALALSAGGTLYEAAALANAAAGVVVGKKGTSVVYPSELLSALETVKA